jgi:asparagine synthase (glutamine-hydrolysing)
MCGIIGVFKSNKDSKESYEIIESYKNLSNRGPDNGLLISNSEFILGFRRLCINDTSFNGNQPMMSKNSKAILVCNGEIYNHKELESEFDIKCESNSDCEIILKLYEKIGFNETIKKLDGVFAVIIIDGDMIYIARDRIGVRPLFLGWTKNKDLAIASLAISLESFCTDISQIPPSIMTYNKKTKVFNKEEYEYCLYKVLDENIQTNIRNTLTNAVKKRLLSDRPIGCLLSGGLDSSLVVSILCKLIGPSNVRTYSIGMEGSPDLEYAKQVSKYLGTIHTQVVFTPEEGIQAIPEVIKTIESYDITTVRASVGMYLLAKYIKDNTDDIVIFSGEGSDELLCGYLYFHFAPSPSLLQEESVRLINDLYMYDVLRADRTISTHGLELRVPFLDKDFLNLSISLNGSQKMPKNGYEKYILRDAFRTGYLPDSILWRRKCAFSDGVSHMTKSWFEIIQDHVETIIDDDDFKNSEFKTKEEMWYKNLFNSYFSNYNPNMYMWMPKWVNTTDPSARVIYNGADKDQM